MEKLKQLIQWRTESGQPVTANGITVTPQSMAIQVRWPYGGWVWNRPVSIQVEKAGQTEQIPIVDVTRLIQLLCAGIAILCWIIIAIQSNNE